MQKARRHTLKVLRPLVGTRFQVLFHSPSGGLFTFPSRYLSAIGHLEVLSLGGWSPRVQTAFHERGLTQERHQESTHFRLRGACPLWRTVPRASANAWFCNSCRARHGPDRRPTTPSRQRVPAYTCRVWAIPFSLATTQGVSVDFLSSGYLDVSVPPLTFLRLCVQRRMTPHYRCQVFPFGDPRVKGCSAPNRGLSQPSTSFIGSWCQGIHRMLLVS